MTLNNIQLPPIVINNLYRYHLVDLTNGKKEIEIIKSDILFLNGSDKDIFLFINNIAVPLLEEDQLNFLSSILSSCKLNLADVAIVGLNKLTEHETFEFFKASKIIAFGIKASAIGLPFSVPEFQVQLYNNQTYVFVPELNLIQKETDLKQKFWKSLKEVFSIKN